MTARYIPVDAFAGFITYPDASICIYFPDFGTTAHKNTYPYHINQIQTKFNIPAQPVRLGRTL